MARRVSAPDYAWVVESKTPRGKFIEYFKIEQAVALPRGVKQFRAAENTIQMHLHELHLKTGLTYRVLYSGCPQDAEHFMQAAIDCPF